MLLLSFAAFLQVAATAVVSMDRKVHPGHARSAQSRVDLIRRTTEEWEQRVKSVNSSGDQEEMKITLRELRAVLVIINQEAVASLLDWQGFDTEKVGTVKKGGVQDVGTSASLGD